MSSNSRRTDRMDAETVEQATQFVVGAMRGKGDALSQLSKLCNGDFQPGRFKNTWYRRTAEQLVLDRAKPFVSTDMEKLRSIARLVGIYFLYAISFETATQQREVDCKRVLELIQNIDGVVRCWQFAAICDPLGQGNKLPEILVRLVSTTRQADTSGAAGALFKEFLVERRPKSAEHLASLLEQFGWEARSDWRRSLFAVHAAMSSQCLISYIRRRELQGNPITIQDADVIREILLRESDPDTMNAFIAACHRARLQVDEKYYSALLTLCHRLGDSDAAESAFASALDNGLSPSISLHRTFCHALAAGGDVDGTRRAFAEILRRWPNEIKGDDFNAVIKAAAIADDETLLRTIVADKRAAQYPKDQEEFRRTIEVVSKRSLHDGLDLLREMQSFEIRARPPHLLPLIRAAVKSMDLSCATNLILQLRGPEELTPQMKAVLRLAAEQNSGALAQQIATHLASIGFSITDDMAYSLALACKDTSVGQNPAALYRMLRAYVQPAVAISAAVVAGHSADQWTEFLGRLRSACSKELDAKNFDNAVFSGAKSLAPRPDIEQWIRSLLSDKNCNIELLGHALGHAASLADESRFVELLDRLGESICKLDDLSLMELATSIERNKWGKYILPLLRLIVTGSCGQKVFDSFWMTLISSAPEIAIRHLNEPLTDTSAIERANIAHLIDHAISKNQIDIAWSLLELAGDDNSNLLRQYIRMSNVSQRAGRTDLADRSRVIIDGLVKPSTPLGSWLRIQRLIAEGRWDAVVSKCADALSPDKLDRLSALSTSRLLQAAMEAARHTGDTQSSESLLLRVEASGFEADPIHYGTLMHAMSRRMDSGACERMYDRMIAKGLQIDDGHVGNLVYSYSCSGDFATAKAVLRQQMDSNRVLGRRTFSGFLAGCRKFGVATEVTWIVSEMDRLGVALDSRNYVLAIETFLASRNTADAVSLYDRMISSNIPLDAGGKALTVAIANAQSGFFAAQTAFQSASQQSPELLEQLQESMMHVYVQRGQITLAMELYRSLTPIESLRHRCARSLASSFVERNDFDRMLELLALCKSPPGQIGRLLCNLIQVGQQTGRLAAAVEEVMKCEEHSLLTNARSYGLVMNGLTHARRPEAVETLFRFAKEKRAFTASELRVLSNLSLRAYSMARRDEDVRRLTDEFIAQGISPDRFTLGTLQGVYRRSGALTDPKASVRSANAEQYKELAVLFDDVVHELNQPVGRLGILVALLRREHGDVAQEKLQTLSRIESCVREIGERLGTYAALTRGRSQISRVPVRDVLTETSTMVRERALRSNIILDTLIEDNNLWGLEAAIEGDPFLVRLALRALLLNAIEELSDLSEGNDRRIIMRAMVSPDDAGDPAWVDIFVRDTGRGVPPEIRTHIFERGFTTKSGRGLGLGLSLVQSVADLHGGRASLVQNTRGGAEFWLRFPSVPLAADTTKEETNDHRSS